MLCKRLMLNKCNPAIKYIFPRLILGCLNLSILYIYNDYLSGFDYEQKQPEACNFIKKDTLAQVFSCEFCETFNSTCFYRTPPVFAFV